MTCSHAGALEGHRSTMMQIPHETMLFMFGLSEFIWPWFPPSFLQTSHTSPIDYGIKLLMNPDLNRYACDVFSFDI